MLSFEKRISPLHKLFNNTVYRSIQLRAMFKLTVTRINRRNGIVALLSSPFSRTKLGLNSPVSRPSRLHIENSASVDIFSVSLTSSLGAVWESLISIWMLSHLKKIGGGTFMNIKITDICKCIKYLSLKQKEYIMMKPPCSKGFTTLGKIVKFSGGLYPKSSSQRRPSESRGRIMAWWYCIHSYGLTKI